MDKAKIAVWVVAAIVVVGLGALILAPQSGVEDVDGAKIDELAAQGVRIIDVRTAGEYQVSHIRGAENVPLNQLEAVAPSWDRSQPVAVYCAVGDRSITAVQYLQELGFEKIYHFASGVASYAGQLESGQGAVASVPTPQTNGTPVLYEFYTDW